MLTLEGAQAELSWSTILRKREGYRAAFAQFDAAKVARFDSRKVERLLQDPGIVRNRLVESTVNNSRRVLDVQKEFGGGCLHLAVRGAAHRSSTGSASSPSCLPRPPSPRR